MKGCERRRSGEIGEATQSSLRDACKVAEPCEANPKKSWLGRKTRVKHNAKRAIGVQSSAFRIEVNRGDRTH